MPAIEKLLAKQQLSLNDIDAIELNEAFASQVLASQQALNVPAEKLNVYGGAIATGHPYGASGAALVTRLFYMEHKHRTIATMGIEEVWAMPHYLKDGHEQREMIFPKKM